MRVNVPIRTWATLLAIAASAGLVTAAYFFGKGLPAPVATISADTAGTNALLASLAAKDSDGDGLPDWEEAMYGTDPHKVDTFGLGMTDAQAVAKGLIVPKAPQAATSTDVSAQIPSGLPGTNSLTDQFGKAMFAQYLQAAPNGAQMTQADTSSFLQGALGAINSAEPEQDAFSASQITVRGSGPATLRTYAANAEAAFAANTIATDKNELTYFRDALQNNDAASLAMVAKIGGAYAKMAAALAKVPVPSELEQYHLALANAIANIGAATSDMALIGTDPLRSALGVSRYQADATNMTQAFASIAQVFSSEQVVIGPGDSGYAFYYSAARAPAILQSATPITP